MKKNGLFIAIGMIAICVIGWLTISSQVVKEKSQYSRYIKEADAWVEKGLYQRAISNYNLALEDKKNEKLYEKVNAAYSLRFKEEPEETIADYMDFLEIAIEEYPYNHKLVNSFAKIYSIQGKYEEVYECLKNAVENGYNTDKIQSKLREARYAFKLKGNDFSGIKQSSEEFYVTARNEEWNIYSLDEGYMLLKKYKYMSPANKDGIVVATAKDSRIVDSTGMVYGIFKKKVTEAGILAEDLVAARIDGVYSYYNDLAEKQFGEYEMAGTFQNGKAAVKDDKNWVLVNKKGKEVSKKFEEIVLDYLGNYLADDLMLAKDKGTYGIYDKDEKLLCKLDCDDVDILTSDKLIAVSKNGKWGFVNEEGKKIVDFVYEEAKSFSCGLAAIKKDGKWGFIDPKGNVVIECQFSDAGYMSENGICPVRTDFPEEEVDKTDNKKSKKVEIMETWKMLQLEIGIQEE